ncbi:hypothetical protein PV325_000634 [Microctonus aethiopoides]|nr:hypothetical protein PV325_000634 [Microctonus aethiopoides]
MGSSGQLYSLSWGEFSSSLTSAVQLLRGHGDLVDVTLAAGGRSFPAHKIVLSAASPFLLDLLKSTPCQHPVVMLAGISSDDLESLLEFVYRGEVSVEPSQLPSLLQAAHCLSIHGLTPPTILTENGEEVPVSSIPTNTEPVTREIMNSCIPIHRRKKRRKSSSSSGKWPRTDNVIDSDDRHDGHGDDDRSGDYEHGKDDTGNPTDDVGEQSEDSNHRSINDWQPTKYRRSSSSSLHFTDVHSMDQDHLIDTKPSRQTLKAINKQQQYLPLHIPMFSGASLAKIKGYNSFQMASTSTTTSSTSQKARGASDCPGICPLCGATLRQARNLRRHLLSSCKYRLNNFAPLQQQVADQMIVEIKPEIDPDGYIGHSNEIESRDSDSEEIICKPSPLPSPTNCDGQFKTRSVSDQPTTCPLCGAILRQSRNLRRHLELLHFAPGNNGKPSVRVRRRKHDFHPPTMVPRPASHSLRIDHHHPHHMRTSENSDYSSMTPLSLTSAISSVSSNIPGSNILGSNEHSTISGPSIPPNSCGSSLSIPPNNGIYSSDNGASMLSCLLPNLPSLPTLSTPHDVFRHGEMLRAGIVYHDSTRQHVRHMQRTNVT